MVVHWKRRLPGGTAVTLYPSCCDEQLESCRFRTFDGQQRQQRTPIVTGATPTRCSSLLIGKRKSVAYAPPEHHTRAISRARCDRSDSPHRKHRVRCSWRSSVVGS